MCGCEFPVFLRLQNHDHLDNFHVRRKFPTRKMALKIMLIKRRAFWGNYFGMRLVIRSHPGDFSAHTRSPMIHFTSQTLTRREASEVTSAERGVTGSIVFAVISGHRFWEEDFWEVECECYRFGFVVLSPGSLTFAEMVLQNPAVNSLILVGLPEQCETRYYPGGIALSRYSLIEGVFH